jgi:hypothetical protein
MASGLVGAFIDAVTAAAQIAEAREIVNVALEEALSVMGSMVGNAGQEVVYADYVVPQFRAAKRPVAEGWPGVDIGEYMDFMGEIVEEGNSIMETAYEEAQGILSETEESIEAATAPDIEE